MGIVGGTAIADRSQASSGSSPPWKKIEELAAEKYNRQEAKIYISELKYIYEYRQKTDISPYDAAEMLADHLVERRDTPLITNDIISYRETRRSILPSELEGTSDEGSDPSPESHDPADCTIHPNVFGERVTVRESWGIPLFTTSGVYTEFDDSAGRMEMNVVTNYGGGAIGQIEMYGVYTADSTGVHEYGTWIDRVGLCRNGGRAYGALFLENLETQSKESTIQEVIRPGQTVNAAANYSDLKSLTEGIGYHIGVQVTGEVQLAPDTYTEFGNPISAVIFGNDDYNSLGFFIWDDVMRVRTPSCITNDPSYPPA